MFPAGLSYLRYAHPRSMLGVSICVSWEKGGRRARAAWGGRPVWLRRSHLDCIWGQLRALQKARPPRRERLLQEDSRRMICFCKYLLRAPSPVSSIFYHNLGFQWYAAHTPPLSPPARILVLLPHIPALPLGAPSLYRGPDRLRWVQKQGPQAQSSSAPNVTADKGDDMPATSG